MHARGSGDVGPLRAQLVRYMGDPVAEMEYTSTLKNIRFSGKMYTEEEEGQKKKKKKKKKKKRRREMLTQQNVQMKKLTV